MKDFAEEYLKSSGGEEAQCGDPLLFMTPEVEAEVLEMNKESMDYFQLGNVLALAATAPLQTIVTSLQLSVKPHKRIYEEPLSTTKEVAKVNTSLTLQEKRRMELAIRSGQNRRPYTAPVYEGYMAAIRGVLSQGPTAFFKGLGFRMFHSLAHYYALTEFSPLSNFSGAEAIQDIGQKLVLTYMLQCVVDVNFNILYMAENRFILQNSLPEFRGSPCSM